MRRPFASLLALACVTGLVAACDRSASKAAAEEAAARRAAEVSAAQRAEEARAQEAAAKGAATPAVEPTPAPPDTTPPVVTFTSMEGAPLADPVVTTANSLLFMAMATDDREVITANQRVKSPSKQGLDEAVSTVALRGGTSVEIPLGEAGRHVLELEVRDAAGNVTIGRLVVDKR